MDEVALNRLAKAVQDLRGDSSQRELASKLGVAQSTVQSWENGKNVPNLENVEKLAAMRGQLPEEFVAYLYGREVGSSLPIEEQIKGMSLRGLARVNRAIAERLGGGEGEG
jgi:transcriptional regulator with XRE-family HTH domain